MRRKLGGACPQRRRRPLASLLPPPSSAVPPLYLSLAYPAASLLDAGSSQKVAPEMAFRHAMGEWERDGQPESACIDSFPVLTASLSAVTRGLQHTAHDTELQAVINDAWRLSLKHFCKRSGETSVIDTSELPIP